MFEIFEFNVWLSVMDQVDLFIFEFSSRSNLLGPTHSETQIFIACNLANVLLNEMDDEFVSSTTVLNSVPNENYPSSKTNMQELPPSAYTMYKSIGICTVSHSRAHAKCNIHNFMCSFIELLINLTKVRSLT